MPSTNSGRPVRFFLILMGGWTAVRFTSGMIGIAPPPAVRPPTVPGLADRAAGRPEYHAMASEAALPLAQPVLLMMTTRMAEPVSSPARPVPSGTTPLAAPVPKHAAPADQSSAQRSAAIAPALPVIASPPAASRDRWRGSAWALWRDGSSPSADAIPAGRLGGSQVGMRIDYDLTPRSSGRASLYGRVSTALNRPASPEAAFGIGWQPARTIAITLAAERRVALGKGARDANALLAIGGFGPTPVLPGLEAEAYAQSGVVGFHSRDLFADGKLSLLSPVSGSPLKLGGSISGGAQPDVERLDIGPELQIRLPLPNVSARMSAEWRQRVAGRASPPSGIAVTLGADF